ncbi:MLP-like protein 28 [Quillaja saponaria]|uniref:MLP-like protein 28 n=1 Tax=Quillaja saponaria TaxID=32244 RepID=A0AAD7KQC3_QUISA|nr:MLP-like protein 28 [Quillaja saponaria]
MGLTGKVEREVEIKVPAQRFYNIFKKEAHHVSTASPNSIQAVHVHEGDWETHGSIKVWKYTVDDGTSGVFKEKVELNDEELSVTLNGLEGDVMQVYKVFKPVYQAIPKDGGISVVKLSIEYEKLREEVPPPDKYVGLMFNITKDIEAHHLK